MTYTPGGMTDEEALRARFAAELQQQTLIRSWVVALLRRSPAISGRHSVRRC